MQIHNDVLTWIVYPLLIMCARIVDVSIGTLRIIFIAKGKKFIAPLLGFVEVLLWLIVMVQIVKHLDKTINYVAYASGFALGNFFGMYLENKLAMGISLIRIITAKKADKLVQHLRSSGLTVTDIEAHGNMGPVKVIFTIIKRREMNEITKKIHCFNPNAFYTVEDVGFVSKAIMPVAHKKGFPVEPVVTKKK